MYNPEIDGPMAKKKPGDDSYKWTGNSESNAKRSGFSKGTIMILALFMIILTLFVVLIFLSW